VRAVYPADHREGLKVISAKSGDIILEIIMRRYENGSAISSCVKRVYKKTGSPVLTKEQIA